MAIDKQEDAFNIFFDLVVLKRTISNYAHSQ